MSRGQRSVTNDTPMKQAFSYARSLTWGLLCLALAVVAWEGGRWARGHLAATGAAARELAAVPLAPPASQTASLQAQRERLLRQPGGLARRLALFRLSEGAASHGDFAAMLEDASLSSEEVSRLVQQWAERDPAACWEWQLAGGRSGVDYTSIIFHAWAKKDPEAAAVAVRSAPADKRYSAAEAVLGVWFRDEEGLAARLAPYLDEISGYDNSAASRWSRVDADGQYSARILALPPGPARSNFLRGYGSGLFDRDWEKGVAWASQIPEADRQAVLAAFAAAAFAGGRTVYYGEQIRKEPGPERLAWAQKWFAEEADEPTRSRLGPRYVETLSATDPAAALAWAQEWLGGVTLSRAVGNVVSTQSAKDQAAAVALIEDLPPGGVRMKATQALAEKWLQKDPAAAVNWTLAQGKDTLDRFGWGSLGSHWAFADAESFRNFVSARAAEVPPDFLPGAIHNLARTDAPGTVAWATTLPENLRDQAVRNSIGEWARADSPAAAKFVAANPDLPVSESTLRSMATRYFANDADAAVTWAASLPAGNRRDAAVNKLRDSIQSEKDTARRDAWLAQLDRANR